MKMGAPIFRWSFCRATKPKWSPVAAEPKKPPWIVIRAMRATDALPVASSAPVAVNPGVFMAIRKCAKATPPRLRTPRLFCNGNDGYRIRKSGTANDSGARLRWSLG